MIKAEYVERQKRIYVLDEDETKVYCDCCEKELKIGSKFYKITTYNNDCWHDSIDSLKHFIACSNDCVIKMTDKYLNDHGLSKNDTQRFEIEKKYLSKRLIRYLDELV